MKKSFRTIVGLLVAFVAIFAAASPEGNLVTNTLVTDAAPSAGPTVLMAAVAKNELRERMLIKNFRWDESWIGRISNKSSWVNQDVIRLNQMGADPAVLIDNNTYPISVNSRTDTSQAISLHKFSTTNTVVTDDEIYALPYDKNGSVQQQHRETLQESIRMHGLHSIAPMGNTANTPVIETTGEDDGTGRKRLSYDDLLNLGEKLDKLKVPRAGRILVLSTQHKRDLLLEDKGLQNEMHNHSNGMLSSNYAGFELYHDIYSPKYDATLNKLAYGSVDPGREASVLFHTAATAKARGSVKMFLRPSRLDPENREAVMGADMYAVTIPTRQKGQGAIVSGTVA